MLAVRLGAIGCCTLLLALDHTAILQATRLVRWLRARIGGDGSSPSARVRSVGYSLVADDLLAVLPYRSIIETIAALSCSVSPRRCSMTPRRPGDAKK